MSPSLIIIFAIVLHFTIPFFIASFELSTSPETTIDKETLLPLKEGSNCTIMCNVTEDGVLTTTEWFIQRPIDSSLKHIGISPETGLVEYPEGLIDTVTITGPVVYKLITYANQFYITNFTRSLHMTKLQCGTLNYNTRRTFILGIEIVPHVHNDSTAVMEGSNISIALNVSGSPEGFDVFPPINYTSWKYNGEKILNQVDIAVGNYNINFIDISRDYAGTFSLSVSNGIYEPSTGFFKLGVQYPHLHANPAVKNDSRKFTTDQANGNFTLVAFNSSSIDGWPTPQVLWIHPSGQHINTSTGRYNIDTTGELIIINVELKDNGTYRCIIYNLIDEIVQKIDLIVLIAADYSFGIYSSSTISYKIYKMSYVIASPQPSVVLSSFVLISQSLTYNVKGDLDEPLVVLIVTAILLTGIFGTVALTVIVIFVVKKIVQHQPKKATDVTTYTINEAYEYLNNQCHAHNNDVVLCCEELNYDNPAAKPIMECNPAYDSHKSVHHAAFH